MDESEVLTRIRRALEAVALEIAPLTGGKARARYKSGNQLVTDADRLANRMLHKMLVRDDEGWLSEESADSSTRLRRERVWIVDPIDGTEQFVAGLPEWAISVALIENGQPVAGGVCNPATKELFLGAPAAGVTCNGKRCRTTRKRNLEGASVLASRNEFERGEWSRFNHHAFAIKPLGSVAYKLALVAAGFADATWTLQPKHEWDVAGGIALILAGVGFACPVTSPDLVFNNREPKLPNLLAGAPGLAHELPAYLRRISKNHSPLKVS